MPRAGLSGPVVIAAAARLADEIGLEGLTLAALAARLGVAVPSLYKHVAGLEDVRRGVAITGLRELGLAMGANADLRGMAQAYRDWARAHPGRYAATLRAVPAGDAEAAGAAAEVLAIVNRALAGYGLVGDAAVDGARLMRATLHGFVSLEAAGGFGMPRDIDVTFDRVLLALERGMEALA